MGTAAQHRYEADERKDGGGAIHDVQVMKLKGIKTGTTKNGRKDDMMVARTRIMQLYSDDFLTFQSQFHELK